MNNFLSLLNHLQFSNPKSGLSNGNGKIIYFDAEELSDRNFDKIDKFAKLNLRAEKFFKDFVLQTAQTQITFGQKVAGATSRGENFDVGEFIFKSKQIFFSIATGVRAS